jgi:hypothetical protein
MPPLSLRDAQGVADGDQPRWFLARRLHSR